MAIVQKTNKSNRPVLRVASALLFLIALSGAHTASAIPFTWEVTATNNAMDGPDGLDVDGFEATFSGTGGTIANEIIIFNDGPGTATITSMVDRILIEWSGGELAFGGIVVFQFTTDVVGPVDFAIGVWNVPDLGLPFTHKSPGIYTPTQQVPIA